MKRNLVALAVAALLAGTVVPAPHDIEQVTKKSGDRGDPVAIKAAVEVVISAARQ